MYRASGSTAAAAAAGVGGARTPSDSGCSQCGKLGAVLKCSQCRQRVYCDAKCQKKHWKSAVSPHKAECKGLKEGGVPERAISAKLLQVFSAGDAGGTAAGGSASAASLPPTSHPRADGGGAVDGVDDEEEVENQCPICLDNEDSAVVDWTRAGMCCACGQCFCSACNSAGLSRRSPNCPICRAPFNVSAKEDFERLWKLVHDRSPGRHTPIAQNNLAARYRNGKGVQESIEEAVKWYRKSAEAGNALAQINLGVLYMQGKGVPFDGAQGLKWLQLAAEQGNTTALEVLAAMQTQNCIPTPLPGTAVTAILLTMQSETGGWLDAKAGRQQALPTPANAAKHNNNKTGRVVEAPSPDMARPNTSFVLLDGEAEPMMFKLINLRIHP